MILIPSSHNCGSTKKKTLSLYTIIAFLKICEDKHVPSVWSMKDVLRIRSCKTIIVGDANNSYVGANGE